jgi:hypothetical protein
MIGTMHLRVTVRTVTSQQVGCRTTWWYAQPAFGIAGMERGQMALLAEEWCSRLQQGAVVGAMWLVAIAAVFTHRRVLPQEGTALFSMTLEALIVERGLQQVGRARATMRSMTIGADHLSGADGMAGGEQGLCLRTLMTVETE